MTGIDWNLDGWRKVMSDCLKCKYWHLCTIELCIEDEGEGDV